MEPLIHSYCQVLGTGDDGSSPCLLVSVERVPRYHGGGPKTNVVLRRYVFNVGEGTQRFCQEHGVKLGTVNKLFLTGTGAEEHAGFAGLILSLSQWKVPAVEVFGPVGVECLAKGIGCFTSCSTTIMTSPLVLGAGESQCSYVLGDEHLEVRCGVLDPAQVTSCETISIASSDSSSSSSGSSGNDSGDSDNDSDSGSGTSGTSESSSSSDGDSGDSDSSESSDNDSDNSSVKGGCEKKSGGDTVQVNEQDLKIDSKKTTDESGTSGDGSGNNICVDKDANALTVNEEGIERKCKAPITSTASVSITQNSPKPGLYEGRATDVEVLSAEEGERGQGSAIKNRLWVSDGKAATASTTRKRKSEADLGVARTDNSVVSKTDFNQAAAVGWNQPVGYPVRGPIVIYQCKVLHSAASTFLILSCPNVAYVRAILDHAIMRSARRGKNVQFVLHLSPEDVVQHPAYAPLLELEAKHVLVACGRRERELAVGGLQHRRVAEKSVKLNLVAPAAFPMHSALRGLDCHAELPIVPEIKEVAGRQHIIGRPLLKVVLLPKSERGIDYKAIPPPLDIAAIREETREIIEEEDLTGDLKRIWANLGDECQLNTTTEDKTAKATHADTCLETSTKRPGGKISHEVSRTKKRARNGPDTLPATCSNISISAVPPPPPPPPPPPLSQVSTYGNTRLPAPCGISPFDGGGLAGAEIFFLGTGCAAPSKHRGCSGILLRIPVAGLMPLGADAREPVRILLDAGEGTLGHLERHFGREGARREVVGLDCVWISHKHADHHSGLFRVIVEHNRAATSCREGNASRGHRMPLMIVAPVAVLESLSAFKAAAREDIKYMEEMCSSLRRDTSWRGGNISINGRECLKHGMPRVMMLLAGMSSVPVEHCNDAYGLVFQPWQNGAKLVYSGDTRPCKRLVEAGSKAAILIHEATFDDAEQDLARKRRHSTTTEALDVAQRMQAREVVLTHFSKRYPRVPVLQPDHPQRYSVAFDGMVLNKDTLPILPAAAKVLGIVLEPQEDDEAREPRIIEII